MKRLVLFPLILCVLWSAPALAGVGMAEAVFKDAKRERTLRTHIWYPSDDGPAARFAENAVFEGLDAVWDGSLRPGTYPLYVLLHGTTGNWRNLSWLAARLAENGAVVCAADHPGYTSGDATPASVIRAWDQPLDATFLVDRMLGSRFRDNIDQSRLFAVGYSLGGYGALALAGARLDLRRFIDFCAANLDRSCRYFRPALPGLAARDFTEAARAIGARDLRIIGRHIIPNLTSYLIVAATLSIPGAILGESGLSFLGIGIHEPMVSWGLLLSKANNAATIQNYPWLLIPGIFITVTVLAFNFLGDALRDAFDPFRVV